MNHVHVRIEQPGLLTRGWRSLTRALGHAADAGMGALEQYTPRGAQRMAESMDDRSFKSFAAMHGAFWCTVPLAVGLFAELPVVTALGVAGMVGCAAYGIYQACRS